MFLCRSYIIEHFTECCLHKVKTASAFKSGLKTYFFKTVILQVVLFLFVFYLLYVTNASENLKDLIQYMHIFVLGRFSDHISVSFAHLLVDRCD